MGGDNSEVEVDETFIGGAARNIHRDKHRRRITRGLKGTYISVEPFHLFRYLDEHVFRYTFRKLPHDGRFEQLLITFSERDSLIPKLLAK